jgi:hypothetical protein
MKTIMKSVNHYYSLIRVLSFYLFLFFYIYFFISFYHSCHFNDSSQSDSFVVFICLRRGVFMGIEDVHRPPALRAIHP